MRNSGIIGLAFLLNSLVVYAQPGECESFHPNWSPDGTKMIFDGKRGDHQGIFLLDLQTRKVDLLFDRPGRDAHPFWFPDGRRIAFQSTRDTSRSLVVDVYAINIDGKNLLKLTDLPGF